MASTRHITAQVVRSARGEAGTAAPSDAEEAPDEAPLSLERVLRLVAARVSLAGVDLSLAQQLMVVYLAILGGIGTAGVPSGSIPFIIGVLVTIGVNPALIAIILGVDRILDMCRTTLNVVGDITAATYVARSEGYELLKPHEPAIVSAGVALPE